MISAQCEACQQDTQYPDVYGGQRLRCKNCPEGWVTMPPRPGFAVQPVPATRPNATPPHPNPAPAPRPTPAVVPPPLSTDEDSGAVLRRARAAEHVPVRYGFNLAFLAHIFWMATILGVGSLLLPMFGYQFSALMALDHTQPVLGIALAVVGGGGLLWWYTKGRQG